MPVTVMDIVDAQLRLQFLGRDVMLQVPNVMASDPAHDPNTSCCGSVEEASCSQHLLYTTLCFEEL